MKYECPMCHCDQLDVRVSATAKLVQYEDGDMDTFISDHHEWDDDSAAMCRKCAWTGIIGDCDTNPDF